MRHFVWRRALRPEEIVESTRWVFGMLALVTLLITLPAFLAVAQTNSTMLFVGLVSSVVLGLSWGAGYLRRSSPWWTDVVDSVAIFAFALACPNPLVSVGLVIPALWFRSLYGSARRGVLRAGLYAGVVIASVSLWAYIPGHLGQVGIEALSGVVPAMFLTAIAGTQLAGGLRAQEQAAQRDAVHMSVGSELLSVTDAAEIRRIAWKAMAEICRATPGLRVLTVLTKGARLSVDGAAGDFVSIPSTLPANLLSTLGGNDDRRPERVNSHAELDAAAGTFCAWTCLSFPSEHPQHGSAWFLLGAPRKVPTEAVVAVVTLANLVTLALHNAQVHARLTELAEADLLTGLANRASFNVALSAALDGRSSGGEVSVLFVDLDDFKSVNDMFGHQAGDDLLREVAARLRRATRPGDQCARLGGDEFAVLLHDTADVATEVARRIVSAVGVGVPVGGGIAYVGASVGVATATAETDLEQLLHRADVAMYAAKAAGKAQAQVFEPGLLASPQAPQHADNVIIPFTKRPDVSA